MAEPTAHDRAGTCEHCGRPLEPLTMDLPLGLGARTWFAECPCAEPRRVAELRQRAVRGDPDAHRASSSASRASARVTATPASRASPSRRRAGRSSTSAGATSRRSATTAPGLTLAGPPGTGKTHLAVAITRGLIERGHAAVIVNVPQLLLTARGTFATDRSSRFDDMLDALSGCAHLVLDDLGRERHTEWVQETLYLVLNARYEQCRATTITTNLDLESLRRRLGEPILDRLAETNQAYWCQWPSHRRRQP